MGRIQLTDRLTRGVIEILDDTTWLGVEALTERYNKRYPPSRLGRIIGFSVDAHNIERVLAFLREGGYVRSEVFSFTDRDLHTPLVQFRLTQKGTQYLASLRR